MIRYYVNVKNEHNRKGLVSLYHQFFTTGYPLPYFATYSQGEATRTGEPLNYDISMADMLVSSKFETLKENLF